MPKYFSKNDKDSSRANAEGVTTKGCNYSGYFPKFGGSAEEAAI